ADIADGPTFARDTTVQRGADLALVLTADPGTVQAGNYAQFVAQITNEGPYPSGTASLEVAIPPGISRDVDMPEGCSVAGALITCQLPGWDVGDSSSCPSSWQSTATDRSNVTMAALGRSTSPRDPNSGNDSDTADLVIDPGTDVSL